MDYGNFKAVLIGAKDCKAPIATSIQGDQGCISIQTPANVLKALKFYIMIKEKKNLIYKATHIVWFMNLMSL